MKARKANAGDMEDAITPKDFLMGADDGKTVNLSGRPAKHIKAKLTSLRIPEMKLTEAKILAHDISSYDKKITVNDLLLEGLDYVLQKYKTSVST